MGIDLSQYMGAYIDGSRENLDTMDRSLLALEQNPNNLDAIEEIFRAAHTLKGMSATMGFEKVAHLTHEMENVLDKLRSKQVAVTAQIIDIIFETFDILRILVNDSISATDSNVDLHGISGKLEAVAAGQTPPAGGSSPQPDGGGEPAPSGYETASAPAGSDNQRRIAAELGDFQLSEFETSGLMDSLQAGQVPVVLVVRLVADCLLKGPRIFMILRSLDTLQCEIKKSVPEVKDLENEKFDRSFKMLLTTTRSAQELKDSIESISEIETAEVLPMGLDDMRQGAGAAPAPVQAPPPPPVQAPPPPVAARAPVAPVAAPPVQQQAPPPPRPSSPAAPVVPEGAPPAPPAKVEEEEEEKVGVKTRETIELVHLVSFTMAGETYALDISQVEGIINLIPITRLPKAPGHIEGIINMRGEIVPVISLRRKLKLDEKVRTPEDQIIILTFEKEKVKVGFLVDSVREVLRLPKTSIDLPSRVSDSVDVEYLNGVGKIGNKIIILLNAHRIIFG